MSKSSLQPLLLAALLTLSACATRYPMGLSKEQWDALPSNQKAEYQAKQYQIDTDNRARAEEARKQAAAQQAEQARLKAEQIRQAYANARYGDIVTVSVQGGSLSYAGKRYPYEPVAFDLIKGETKRVPFRGRGIQTIATEYVVRLSDDGNTIYFDDQFDNHQRAVFVNHDWSHGETYQPASAVNDVNVGLSGMTFVVRHKSVSGTEPTRMIIEQR